MGSSAALVAGAGTWVVVSTVYLLSFWALVGQTPGMRFLGIRLDTGAEPGIGLRRALPAARRCPRGDPPLPWLSRGGAKRATPRLAGPGSPAPMSSTSPSWRRWPPGRHSGRRRIDRPRRSSKRLIWHAGQLVRRTVKLALACVGAFLLLAAPAAARIPASLHNPNNCDRIVPAPGISGLQVRRRSPVHRWNDPEPNRRQGGDGAGALRREWLHGPSAEGARGGQPPRG